MNSKELVKLDKDHEKAMSKNTLVLLKERKEKFLIQKLKISYHKNTGEEAEKTSSQQGSFEVTKEDKILEEVLSIDLLKDDLEWDKLGEFFKKQESTHLCYQIQDIVEPKDSMEESKDINFEGFLEMLENPKGEKS